MVTTFSTMTGMKMFIALYCKFNNLLDIGRLVLMLMYSVSVSRRAEIPSKLIPPQHASADPKTFLVRYTVLLPH